MPSSNRVRTIRDLTHAPSKDGNEDRARTAPGAAFPAAAAGGDRRFDDSKTNANHNRNEKHPLVCHIPTLPQADQAKALLDRVVAEFLPILQRRGYPVQSISELCCCNDGLDFDKTTKRRRKLRLVSHNIWGYNRITTFGRRQPKKGGVCQSSTIHLRLRHAGKTHHGRFLPYEDVAGTLAHELAHCQHQPHNKDFYKLMDDLLEEHALLMAGGVTRNHTPAPSFGGTGHVLGRASKDATTGGDNPTTGRPPAEKNPWKTGTRLGGDPAFQQWMTPAEAAVAAAEARRRAAALRLRGDHCCRPCLVDDDDEDDDQWERLDDANEACKPVADTKPPSRQKANHNNGKGIKQRKREQAEVEVVDVENWKPNAQQQTLVAAKKARSKKVCLVDLTVDDDDDDKLPRVASREDWSCTQCTLRNAGTALVCAVCRAAPA